MKASRRGFLTGFGAVVALPAAAIEAMGKSIFTAPTEVVKDVAKAEFGWLEPYKSNANVTLTEIITTTLRQKHKDILGNIASHNMLLTKLKKRLEAKDAKKAFRFDNLGPGYDYADYDKDWFKSGDRAQNVRGLYASQRKVS